MFDNGDNGGNIAARYACHCLNVRFQSTLTQTSPPDENRDPAFIPVFVGDDGIKIHHIQTTVRSKSRGIPISGTNRCLQYTNLRCLICDTVTYQVCNTVPIETESVEGPLLPSDDWAETEIMKGPNGWIEIHKDCLTGDAILLVEASPNFSHTFSLSLPPMTTSPTPPIPVIALSSAILGSPSAASAPPSPIERLYLSSMKPLYLPPPYSQSHPTFVHLASVATQQSNALRMAGEQYISDVVSKKIAEIEAIEADFKRQTERLWKQYREVADRLTSEKHGHSAALGSSTRLGASDQTTNRGTTGSPAYGTPVTVRDFTPIRVAVQRSPPPSVSRPSMLSASLASSSHYPNDRIQKATNVPDSPSSISSRTESSTLVPPMTISDAQSINVLQFRRNIDDSINTAHSYRYFVNLEEDMERHRKEKDAFRKKWAPEESQLDASALIESPNGNKKPNKKTLVSLLTVDEFKEENESVEPRETHLKGKRKVTFDAKPAVVTIKREVEAENEDEEAEAAQDPREMIFNLDDMEGITTPGSEPTLPFIEQPTVFRPVRKARIIDTAGLPGSLSALRGASLSSIPHMRSRSQPGVDTSFRLVSVQRPSPPENHSSNSSNSPIAIHDQQDGNGDDDVESDGDEEPFDPRNEMILDLVAAGTPSHRGAWKPDSKAWLTFTQRRGRKGKAQPRIPEEVGEGNETFGIMGVSRLDSWYDEESDDERKEDRQAHVGIPGSMPINIVNRIKPREILSLASYKPKSALEVAKEQEEGRPEFKNMSSAAIRKLQYAERDQGKAIDPGALDFTVDDDSDEPGEEDPPQMEPGSRGRKHALKILQKRNEVPAEGMWRSLAE